MLKGLLFLAVCAVAVVINVIVRLPDDFKIERSSIIEAPIEVVFNQVNNLHQWNEWSPWAKLDPQSKATYAGPAEGVGASFMWSGNDKVGVGKMTIVESVPNQKVRFDLNFEKPMKANNQTVFFFKGVGDQTVVTWTMTGKNNFIGKAFSLMMNCDKMVGGDFERGLAQLNTLAKATVK